MSTQARRVLVVTAGESDGLPEAIHDRLARTRAEVLVVTPALPPIRGRSEHRGRRPGARRAAEQRACRCVEQLRLSGFDAEAVAGDPDPAQAIADALALFDADVLVVDGDLAERARRRRFGLPIVRLAHAA
jgi:hypothetical protein